MNIHEGKGSSMGLDKCSEHKYDLVWRSDSLNSIAEHIHF